MSVSSTAVIDELRKQALEALLNTNKAISYQHHNQYRHNKSNTSNWNMMHHSTATATTAIYSKRFKYDHFEAAAGSGAALYSSTYALGQTNNGKMVKNELMSPTGKHAFNDFVLHRT